MATLAFCSLLRADAAPALFEQPWPGSYPRLVRVIALAVQAVQDDRGFRADQQDLDNLDFVKDLSQDHVLLARLQVAKTDVVRATDVAAALRQALLAAAAHVTGGTAGLLAAIEQGGGLLRSQVEAVMSGQPLPDPAGAEEDELYGLNVGSRDDNGGDNGDDLDITGSGSTG